MTQVKTIRVGRPTLYGMGSGLVLGLGVIALPLLSDKARAASAIYQNKQFKNNGSSLLAMILINAAVLVGTPAVGGIIGSMFDKRAGISIGEMEDLEPQITNEEE